MTLKAMRKRIVIVLASLMMVLIAILFLASPSYDVSSVHPSIRNLQQPYRLVTAHYYLDGGSIGLEITDRNGKKLQLVIPIYDGPGDKNTYHRLFVGATDSRDKGAVEVPFTDYTRRMIVPLRENC